MIVSQQCGGVIHRPAIARCLVGAVAIDIEEVATRVPHRVERDHMPADQHILVVGEVAYRVGYGVQIMGGIADLVNQAVVNRVVITAQMETGAGAAMQAAILLELVPC